MSSSQDLEQLYYKLNFINDELSTKNEDIQKTSEDLKDITRLLILHTDDLKNISQTIQESITLNIPIAAKQIAKEATFQIEENLKVSFNSTAGRLIEASRMTEERLKEARKALSVRNWLIGGISFAASIFTALIISYFYLQRIEILTTKQFIKTYKYGLLIKEIWPKLDEKERERLNRFLYDKL